MEGILKPLRDRKEPVYVLAGSEAEGNPNKEARIVKGAGHGWPRGAQAPANPGKTTLLPGRGKIKEPGKALIATWYELAGCATPRVFHAGETDWNHALDKLIQCGPLALTKPWQKENYHWKWLI